MGNVNLNINGRPYAIACDDGQERRVMELGHQIDKRLREVSRAAGAVSEQHLMVLTALFMADELQDAKDKLEETQRNPINATPPAANDAQTAEREAHMADMISALARKIEAVSGQLEKAQASA